MIACLECIDRFKSWGDDPRVKSGRYRLSGCDYCNKPQYYRDIEQPQKIDPEPEWTKRQWYKVQQLQSEVADWRQKHAEALLAIDKLLDSNKRKTSDMYV